MNITITIDKAIARRILRQLEHAAEIAEDNYFCVKNTDNKYKEQFKEGMETAREDLKAFKAACKAQTEDEHE